MSLKKCNITYFSPSVAMMYFQSRLMIILTLGPTSHSLASQATGSLFSLSLLHIFWRIGAQLKKTKLVVVEQKRTSLSVCNSYSEWAKILKLSIRFNWTQLNSAGLREICNIKYYPLSHTYAAILYLTIFPFTTHFAYVPQSQQRVSEQGRKGSSQGTVEKFEHLT